MNQKIIALFSLLFACHNDNLPTNPGLNPVSNPAVEIAAESPQPVKLTDLSSLVGWWDGSYICLDLTLSGDAELSIFNDIKFIIQGNVSITEAKEDALTLQFSVARIWESHWISNCRKNVGGAKWIKEKDVLGLTMRPDESVTLMLAAKGDGRAELCGKSCVTLNKNLPRLAKTWWHPGRLKRGTQSFKPDDLLSLELRDTLTTLELADGESPTSLYGESVVTYKGDDQFQMVFTPRKDRLPKKETIVLGVPVSTAPIEFTIKKTPNHHIEICAKTCSTLERIFNPDDTDP